jgi:hypothetical protein
MECGSKARQERSVQEITKLEALSWMARNGSTGGDDQSRVDDGGG